MYKNIYNSAQHYEIAFSWRDIPHEVNILEHCINRYSKIRVRKVLEIGCGNSPHMIEFLCKGYEYTGLDLDSKMLDYSHKKVKRHNRRTSFFHKNMVRFSLP